MKSPATIVLEKKFPNKSIDFNDGFFRGWEECREQFLLKLRKTDLAKYPVQQLKAEIASIRKQAEDEFNILRQKYSRKLPQQSKKDTL